MELCRHGVDESTTWCGECEKHALCATCGSEYLTEEFGGCGECLSC